jgi:hypothetical protein
MRWVCPRCHNQVSIALTECPYCAKEESEENPAEAPMPPPLGAPPQTTPRPPELAAPPPVAATPPPAAVEARVELPPPRRVARPRRVAVAPPTPIKEEKEEEETPFWRGVRMGVGFALAVAVILFLLAFLLFWLRHIGWQPYFENLTG